VIGVELVQELHEMAEQNIARTTRRLRSAQIQLICADVREYRIPDDVTVVFMNNSVRGSIFEGVLADISGSIRRNPRRMRLIYGNPLEDEAVLATSQWRKVRTIAPRRRRANWPIGGTCVYEFILGGRP
jgi:hypothetical protein